MTVILVVVLVLIALGFGAIIRAPKEGYSPFKVFLYLFTCILRLFCPQLQPPDSFAFLLKKPPELSDFDSSEEIKKDHDMIFGSECRNRL
ncbi:MAG: hypothetical protein LBT80_04655 [Lactobacillaceae bacterium]|jgi:hypothetical protein|nr:hypothetical protein [Lactobacillaceae bacterium]